MKCQAGHGELCPILLVVFDCKVSLKINPAISLDGYVELKARVQFKITRAVLIRTDLFIVLDDAFQISWMKALT